MRDIYQSRQFFTHSGILMIYKRDLKGCLRKTEGSHDHTAYLRLSLNVKISKRGKTSLYPLAQRW